MSHFYKDRLALDESFNPQNPGALFALVGYDMMWNEFAYHERKAVKIFKEYTQFKNELNDSFHDIDFRRTVDKMINSRESIIIDAGTVMYLKSLNLKEPTYIAFEKNLGDARQLSPRTYDYLISLLNNQEVEYAKEFSNYIEKNIAPVIEEASEDNLGFKCFDYAIPVNTAKFVQYHRFLASDTIKQLASEDYPEKWKRISSAPIFSKKSSFSKENPIVPISIDKLDVFILDWLCYATMARPTWDTEKLLRYVSEDYGVSNKDAIIKAYGENAYKLMIKVMDDLNGQSFRSFVRLGLELEDAKDREQVIAYLETQR